MDLLLRRTLAVLASIALIPCLFLAILACWSAYDNILGTIAVSRFIRDHQPIVARRLADPKVHSFSLAHDPDHSATLLIRFDVDDKATYLMLEDDLDDHWAMRFPARWDTKLRSKEDLGNNFGFAAQGIGLVVEAVNQFAIAAVVSIVLPVGLLCLDRRRRSRLPREAGGGPAA